MIRLFASKQPAAMRRRLAEMERDVKLGKLTRESYETMQAEMLVALKKLGEPLTPQVPSPAWRAPPSFHALL